MRTAAILCFLVLLLYHTGNLYAQVATSRIPTTLDSLNSALTRSTGDKKAATLTELASLYAGIDADSATMYATMAESIYKKAGQDTSLFNMYIRISQQMDNAGHTPERIAFIKKAAALMKNRKLPLKFNSMLYNEQGYLQHYTGNYDSAVLYFKQMLQFGQDTITKINALQNIAYSYNASGETVKALGNYLEALHLADKIDLKNRDNLRIKMQVLMRIGILYEDDGDNFRSEEYYKKALPLASKVGLARGLFSLYSNMGVLYNHMERNEESLRYLLKADSLLPQLNIALYPAISNLNIGNTLVGLDRCEEAIPRFNKALKVFTAVQDNRGITLSYRQLGEAYFKLRHWQEAIKHETKAIELGKKFGFENLVEDAVHDLHQIYEGMGDYKNAYKYVIGYLTVRDTAVDRGRRTKIGLLEKEYELARQEEEKQKLEKENEARKVQAQVDRATRLGLLSVSAAILAIAGVVVIAYYRTRSKNKLLAMQKEKIQESNRLITQQSEQLQEAAQAKTRFFANVSHELRTPVTLLNGMLELMHTEEGHSTAPAKTFDKMKIALASSARLQSLVDEVLDLSRLEVNKVALKKRRKELAPLLNRIVFAFESLLVKKNISLVYEVSSLEGLFLEVDEDKFEKIINNLIYNAVKFNKENGWIKITGSIDPEGASIILNISDGGIGIVEKDLPYIFDRFYQSHSSHHKHAQGIGIGLSLVKEFTELHGGSVSVTSKLHEGTNFSICLPITGAISSEDEDEEAKDQVIPDDITFEEFGNRPAVLFVEDNDEMRYYLKEILGSNVAFTEAKNGIEGLAWLKANTPDLIISDVMMPEMDGYEFLTRLKNNENFKNIPVIMLTARASEEDLLYGLSLGVDDYVVKPFNAKELKIRVHNLLTNHRMRLEWQSKPLQPEEKIEAPENAENKLFLEKVQAFVEERAQNSLLGIADLADHMAMSERQLYRKCGVLTGMTPAQLIKEVRLKMAYKLLMEHQISKVGELAARIGFDNSAYFSRQFAERFGKRPVEFL